MDFPRYSGLDIPAFGQSEVKDIFAHVEHDKDVGKYAVAVTTRPGEKIGRKS